MKLVNTAATGTCYWHQVEVLANSIDNPSMQRWQGTNPVDIPVGWVNESLVNSSGQSANAHSGSLAFQINSCTKTVNRADYSLGVGTPGDFYTIGTFSYYVAGQAPFEFFGGISSWFDGNSATANFGLDIGSNPNTWRHHVGVARRTTGFDANAYVGQFNQTDDFTIDDFYAFRLTPVSLTVTPADAANGIESGQLRVDGRDVNLIANMPGLGTTSGTYTVGWRPRHSPLWPLWISSWQREICSHL